MNPRTRDRLVLAGCGLTAVLLLVAGPPTLVAGITGPDSPEPTVPVPGPAVPARAPTVPARPATTGAVEPADTAAGAVADARAAADRATASAARAEIAAGRAEAAARAATVPEPVPAPDPVPSAAARAPSAVDLPPTGAPAPSGSATVPPMLGSGAPGSGSAAQALGWGVPTRVEEFDGAAPGPGWSLYDGPGHAGNGRRTPSAVTVRDGVLTMNGDAAGNTGGMAWLPGSMYGRWEARVRAPVSDPTYHAVLLLWPDAENWPVGGEVDFMEMFDPARQTTEFFLHYGADNSQVHGSVDVDATGWHDWAVEWGPGHIAAYVDGREWFRTTDTSTFPPGPMHMTIQLDWFPDGGAVTPSSMQVDWVRFYPITGSGASPAPLDAVGGVGAAPGPGGTPAGGTAAPTGAPAPAPTAERPAPVVVPAPPTTPRPTSPTGAPVPTGPTTEPTTDPTGPTTEPTVHPDPTSTTGTAPAGPVPAATGEPPGTAGGY